MRRVLLVAAFLFPLLLGCGKKVSTDECDAMLDRYLDLSMTPSPEIAHLPPKQAESVTLQRKNERRDDPSFAAARRRCEHEVTRTQLACAMEAPTANDWEACLD